MLLLHPLDLEDAGVLFCLEAVLDLFRLRFALLARGLYVGQDLLAAPLLLKNTVLVLLLISRVDHALLLE